jgi:RNA polymerase sigma-70 factor, ECF subfamily
MHAHAATEALPMSGTQDGRVVAAGQLIQQATGGDLEAFEELVRRMQRRVYGFAYQHLRDFDEAYDLTQEIFVKLYRNLARYDADRPFEPWFWKLAANTTINYRRKRVPTPTDQSVDQGAGGTEALGGPAHDPALVDALAQLDPAYRLPVLLHYYADLPLVQVATSLNLSVPAIKSRLHRARALLRNSLAEGEEAGNQ